LTIEWRESEGPPVQEPTHAGFGSRLIKRSLAHELGGNVALQYPAAGVVCTIEALVTHQAAATPAASWPGPLNARVGRG